jgi:hypothetical protein
MNNNTEPNITRTFYSAPKEVKHQDFIRLDVNNLSEALSIAIDYAGQPNSENFNACCLQIAQDGTFCIVERCYRNTVYSSQKHTMAYYNLTVSADAYPAQAWPFSLTEFCAYFGIPVSSREWLDMSDKKRPSMADIRVAAQRSLTYLADLNGSPWIAGDGVGEVDMRQRAKGLQGLLYKVLNGK